MFAWSKFIDMLLVLCKNKNISHDEFDNSALRDATVWCATNMPKELPNFIVDFGFMKNMFFVIRHGKFVLFCSLQKNEEIIDFCFLFFASDVCLVSCVRVNKQQPVAVS